MYFATIEDFFSAFERHEVAVCCNDVSERTAITQELVGAGFDDGGRLSQPNKNPEYSVVTVSKVFPGCIRYIRPEANDVDCIPAAEFLDLSLRSITSKEQPMSVEQFLRR